MIRLKIYSQLIERERERKRNEKIKEKTTTPTRDAKPFILRKQIKRYDNMLHNKFYSIWMRITCKMCVCMCVVKHQTGCLYSLDLSIEKWPFTRHRSHMYIYIYSTEFKWMVKFLFESYIYSFDGKKETNDGWALVKMAIDSLHVVMLHRKENETLFFHCLFVGQKKTAVVIVQSYLEVYSQC